MIRFSIPALALGAALFSIQPADACHHYAHWSYPWAQRCGVEHGLVRSGSDSRRGLLHTVSDVPPILIGPDVAGTARTPEEIADENDHNFAVGAHHEDINKMMIILHTEEDAARAAGLKE